MTSKTDTHSACATYSVISGAISIGPRPVFTIMDNSKSEWTPHDEKRFLDLARKEAHGTISDAEIEDLNLQETQRNALKTKRTFHEILANKRQMDRMSELMISLKYEHPTG